MPPLSYGQQFPKLSSEHNWGKNMDKDTETQKYHVRKFRGIILK